MIQFNIPYMTDLSIESVTEELKKTPLGNPSQLTLTLEALRSNHKIPETKRVVLTQSATQALEIMALCMELTPNDEIIMPSFTYAATANAFARTGAKIVFADIDPYTLNITADTIAPLISEHTRAIMPIHYGGISANMDALKQHINGSEILLMEDAAHGIGASYFGNALGTIGTMGCLSFHHTKNITAGGLGGALIYDEAWHERIQNCLYQGTNRMAFLEGKVTAYQWEQLGGEFLMSHYHQLFLESSIAALDWVTNRRRQICDNYYQALSATGLLEHHLSVQHLTNGAYHNGHIFSIILNDGSLRRPLMKHLNECGIQAYTHYEPLHLSKAGLRYGEVRSSMNQTERITMCLLRLPLHVAMTELEQERVIHEINKFFKGSV